MPLLELEPRVAGARPPGERSGASRMTVRVRLRWADGGHGSGDVAIAAGRDDEAATVLTALERYRRVLAAAAPGDGNADLLAACAAEFGCPPALAAVDLALWDRAGRAAGRPVCELLVPGAVDRLFLAAPVDAIDPYDAGRQAAGATAEGYVCVRAQVGLGGDPERLTAVRTAAGPRMAIRAEAARRWSTAEQALAGVRPLVRTGIELVEDPVDGLESLAWLRERSPIPIALVATAAAPEAVATGAADAVRLSVGRCGGISGVFDQGVAARAAGAHLYVDARGEGPLATAGALHAAAALSAGGTLAPCGFDRPAGAGDGGAVLRVDDGMAIVPTGPGLLGWDRS